MFSTPIPEFFFVSPHTQANPYKVSPIWKFLIFCCILPTQFEIEVVVSVTFHSCPTVVTVAFSSVLFQVPVSSCRKPKPWAFSHSSRFSTPRPEFFLYHLSPRPTHIMLPHLRVLNFLLHSTNPPRIRSICIRYFPQLSNRSGSCLFLSLVQVPVSSCHTPKPWTFSHSSPTRDWLVPHFPTIQFPDNCHLEHFLWKVLHFKISFVFYFLFASR